MRNFTLCGGVRRLRVVALAYASAVLAAGGVLTLATFLFERQDLARMPLV